MKERIKVQYLWGKLSKNKKNWHALLWHLIDAGVVARSLWNLYLSDSFKKGVSEDLGLDHDHTRNLVSFWISLHDIGKAGPAFQQSSPIHKKLLEEAGLNFPKTISPTQGYHGLATTWIIRDQFLEHYKQNARFLSGLSMILGGHHGEIPDSGMVIDSTYQKDHLGDEKWGKVRLNIISNLESVFKPPKDFHLPEDLSKTNAILLLTAGLTTAADWIASNEDYFCYENTELFIQNYLNRSEQNAMRALKELGWGGWQAEGAPMEFSNCFPDFSPNTMQEKCIHETQNLESPFFAILESATGSGKTESALLLADSAIQKEQKSGFYIAMPSQATSNQMFERTVNFLSNRYPKDHLNVHLVHGAALLNDFYEKTRISSINQDSEDKFANITSEEWFLPRKKTLLAPFGVGTVDQTFMSVMRSKHFFLRLFGLSNKIIIFDEVHAYDVYMVEIFKRLLGWMRAVNSSVIILSATLPHTSRVELVEAFSGNKNSLPTQPLPRLTISNKEKIGTFNLGDQENRTIKLNWIDDESLESCLIGKLSEGGNAAIICNRVARAQEIYDRLTSIFPEEVVLFHSRFPHCWRADIEKRVLERYGKDDSTRPRRSILVATQVIEQSLDLDFDLILSDLAPVDLLIQRIGRLHRHTEVIPPLSRPEYLSEPEFVVFRPKLNPQGLPIFGKDEYIYKKYILERTFFILTDKKEIVLPSDSDTLINGVYSQEKSEKIPSGLWQEIFNHLEEMTQKDAVDQTKASNQLIPQAHRNIFNDLRVSFDDENDPNSFSIMQTLTRNALPTVQLVCLLKTKHGLSTLFGNRLINLEKIPDKETVKACLQSSLTITNQQLVKHFLGTQLPAAWKKAALIRTKFPIVFENHRCEISGKMWVLDREKGLFEQN